MKKIKGFFFSGTSGLVTAIPQREFPQEHNDKSRLAYYALQINSIEINSSFYKIPRAVTVSNWATMVSDNFRFTFKLWKEITHQKQLAFSRDAIEKFFSVIDHVGDKKGCVLIQFPPGVKIDLLQQFEQLLIAVNQINKGWNIAVEFRHPSWYQEKVYELLVNYKAGLVYHDKTGSATPLIDLEGDFIYQRFHGPGGDYKGSYDDGVLYEYSLYIQEWREDGKMVFVYFNNTAGDALKNLNLLKRYVDQ
jgi:uncharacterized protein YecE (DUF72 family)